VWGVQGLSGHELIDAVIAKTEEFFRSVGTPTKLSDCGLTPADCQVIVKQFEERNSKLGEHEAIGLQEVEGILALCA
jgi:NADP-dependent alcohol dehydrogenase